MLAWVLLTALDKAGSVVSSLQTGLDTQGLHTYVGVASQVYLHADSSPRKVGMGKIQPLFTLNPDSTLLTTIRVMIPFLKRSLASDPI